MSRHHVLQLPSLHRPIRAARRARRTGRSSPASLRTACGGAGGPAARWAGPGRAAAAAQQRSGPLLWNLRPQILNQCIAIQRFKGKAVGHCGAEGKEEGNVNNLKAEGKQTRRQPDSEG